MDIKRFLKKAPINKSVQFELIPVGETAQTIKNLEMEEYDSKARELVDETAPTIDAIIKLVTNEALSQVDCDFASIIDKRSEADLRKTVTKKVSSAIDNACKRITGVAASKINSAEFISAIPETANKYNIAYNADAFEKTNGKLAVFKSFLESRKTVMSTWLIDRIFENHRIYRANADIYKKLLESPLAEDITDLYPQVEYYTDIAQYTKILSQDSIDAYNKALSGTSNENGVETKGIIMLITEYNHRKGVRALPVPKKLHKQILAAETKAFQIKTINNDNEAKSYIAEATESAIKASEDIKDIIENADKDDVVVKYNNLHSLSFYAYGDHSLIPNTIKSDALRDYSLAYEEAKTNKERQKLEKSILNIENALSKNQYTFVVKRISHFCDRNGYKTTKISLISCA